MTMLPLKALTLWLSVLVLGAVVSQSSASTPKGQRQQRLRQLNHVQELELQQKQRRRAVKGFSDEQAKYFDRCRNEFKSNGVAADGIISQNDFAREYAGLCDRFTTDAIEGYECPEPEFSALGVGIQLVFAFALCPETDPEPQRQECVASLASLNSLGTEFGFISTNDRWELVTEEVEQLCFRLFPFVFPNADPIETGGPADTAAPATSPPTISTEAPTDGPTKSPTPPPTPVVVTDPSPTVSPAGNLVEPSLPPAASPTANGFNQGEGGSGNQPDGDTIGGDELLGRNGIIGIAVAAAACLLCCVCLVGRRRRRSDIEEDSLGKRLEAISDGSSHNTEGSPDLKFSNMDAMADTGAVYDPDYNSRSIQQFDPNSAANAIAMGQRRDSSSSNASRVSSLLNRTRQSGPSVDQIINAVDSASWDDVYTLASQLAEKEDLSTLSSAGKARRSVASAERKNRSYLSEEDQERTRTLDELIEHGDWTGLAVTAALFAGESGNTRGTAGGKDSRSLIDRITGKRMSSRAAAEAAEENAAVNSPPAAAFAGSRLLLGNLTDDTKSGTEEGLSHPGASFDTPSPPHSPLKGQNSPGRLDSLREDIDQAVDCGDWDKVLLLSSKVEADENFRENMAELATNTPPPRASEGTIGVAPPQREDSIPFLEAELDRAIYFGDWAMVTYFANRIIQKRGAGEGDQEDSKPAAQSTALVPRSSNSPPGGSVDTEANKRQTIERLARAKSYKGVSIMAGLYSLETKMTSQKSMTSEIPSGASTDLTTTESSSGPGWLSLFSPSGKTADTGASGSTTGGWMGLVNLASATDSFSAQYDTRTIQEQHSSTPTPMTPAAPTEREEVQLTPFSQVPSTDTSTRTDSPPQLQGARQLIPYWSDRLKQLGGSQDSDDLDKKPSARQ